MKATLAELLAFESGLGFNDLFNIKGGLNTLADKDVKPPIDVDLTVSEELTPEPVEPRNLPISTPGKPDAEESTGVVAGAGEGFVNAGAGE